MKTLLKIIVILVIAGVTFLAHGCKAGGCFIDSRVRVYDWNNNLLYENWSLDSTMYYCAANDIIIIEVVSLR